MTKLKPVILVALALALTVSAAPVISVSPVFQKISAPTTVDIDISGVGDVPIGAFYLTLSFDPTIVSPIGEPVYGTDLGDPNLLDAITYSDGSTPGQLILADDSLLAPADLSGEPDAFTLVTVQFAPVNQGISPVSISGSVADANANPLNITFANGAIQVIPEPGTGLLFVVGMCTLFRRKVQRYTTLRGAL